MLKIEQMRQEYIKNGLDLKDLNTNPFIQFEKWFNQAIQAEILEPNAMTLSTVGNDMMPSIRLVLLKIFNEEGFVFFTNYKSKKALQISQNPKAALHFSWMGLERQLKIEGSIEKISKTASLKYFLSRPKGSQIGAWVSHQSQIISSRALLENKFDEIKNKFLKEEVPFPSFWGGYIVKPLSLEFWQGGANRLHDRFEYKRDNLSSTWKLNRLAP